jgi:hypothetical protein
MPPDVVAMALDQSPNHTGWAIGRPRDTKPLFGKFALPPWGNEEPARLYALFQWLRGMIRYHAVTHLFYELDVPAAGKGKGVIVKGRNGLSRAIVVNSKDPAILRNQNAIIAMIWLMEGVAKVPVAPIDVNRMRQRFIGCQSVPGLQGESQRSELKKMALKACAMRGYIVEDDNVAEAIGHLDFGLSSLDPKGHGAWSSISARRTELNLWNGVGL